METITIVEDIIEGRKGFKFLFFNLKPCNTVIEVSKLRKPERCPSWLWLGFVHLTIVPKLFGAYKTYGHYELKDHQKQEDFKEFGLVTIELDEKGKKLVHVKPLK